MRRDDAHKVIDDITDQKIKADLLGLLTELRDKPEAVAAVIDNYRARIAGHVQAHATASGFIDQNFREEP